VVIWQTHAHWAKSAVSSNGVDLGVGECSTSVLLKQGC
jgi:hypothetical protein